MAVHQKLQLSCAVGAVEGMIRLSLLFTGNEAWPLCSGTAFRSGWDREKWFAEVVLPVSYSPVSWLDEGVLPLTVLPAAFESISFTAVSVASMPRIPYCLCTLILLCESKISVLISRFHGSLVNSLLFFLLELKVAPSWCIHKDIAISFFLPSLSCFFWNLTPNLVGRPVPLVMRCHQNWWH